MSALLRSFVEYDHPVEARSVKPVLSVVPAKVAAMPVPEALRKEPALREALAYVRLLLRLAALPFVALGWLIALPFIALGMLSWIGVKVMAASA